MAETLRPPQQEVKTKPQQVGLLSELPEEAQKNLSEAWKIPVGMNAERINSSKENQINFLLQKIGDNLDHDSPQLRAEAGRILSHVRQTLDDINLSESKDPDRVKRLQAKAYLFWTGEGGQKANELYKEQSRKEKEVSKEKEKTVKPEVGQMWEFKGGGQRRILDIRHEGGKVIIRVSKTREEKEQQLINLLKIPSNITMGYPIKKVAINKLEDLLRYAQLVEKAGVISQEQIDKIINEPNMNGLQLTDYLKDNDPDLSI